MIRPALTKGERRIYDVIRAELVAGRPAPSYEELLVRVGLRSKGNAHRMVSGIVAKGYLTHVPGKNRSLALPPGAETYTVHLPPDVDARLGEHVAAWAATPEHVIVRAVAEYLARRP